MGDAPDIDAVDLELKACVIRDDAEHHSLVSADLRVFILGRRLCDCLLGYTRAASAGVRSPDGRGYVASTDPSARYCIKVANKECVRLRVSTTGQPCGEDFMREMRILKYLSTPGHPSIVRLLAMYHDADNYYAVMEYVDGGELHSIVEDSSQGLGEPRALRYTRQLFSALHYLRQKRIAHLDLGGENVMLCTRTDFVKIIDFGLAIATNGDGGPPRTGIRGKQLYMEPRVVQGLVYMPFEADLWSVAVLVFVMLCGVPPWDVAVPTSCQRFALVTAGRLRDLIVHWGFDARMPPAAVDWLVAALEVDPERRLTFETAVAHPWLSPPAPPGAGAGAVPEGKEDADGKDDDLEM